jgi:hypothetical protein
MSIAIPLLPHIRGRSRRFTTYLAHPLNSTPTFNTVMTRDVSRHPAIRIQDDYKPPQRVSRPTLSRNPHHLLLISHACSLQQARGTPLTLPRQTMIWKYDNSFLISQLRFYHFCSCGYETPINYTNADSIHPYTHCVFGMLGAELQVRVQAPPSIPSALSSTRLGKWSSTWMNDWSRTLRRATDVSRIG